MAIAAVESTVDSYKFLTPLERQVLFLESRTGEKITQIRYRELLLAHCKQ